VPADDAADTAATNYVTCTLRLTPTQVFYKDSFMVNRVLDADIDFGDFLRSLTVKWLIERIEDNREEYDVGAATLLGRHLYEIIFRGDVREEFEERVRYTRQYGYLLRLALVFDRDASHLAKLPWEFLYSNREDGNDGFLAGDVSQFTLTRFIPPPDPKERRKQDKGPVRDRPLRVLFAVSAPDTPAEKAFEFPAIRKLDTLLSKHAKPDLSGGRGPAVDVARLANPTYDDLARALAGQRRDPDGTWRDSPQPWFPDVVHIVGEGVPGAITLHRSDEAIRREQAAEGGLGLGARGRMPAGKEQTTGGELLRNLFKQHPPQFVFLQTCFSAKVDSGQLYTAAESIMQAGVPAVLAMQYDIERGAADSFAECVYRELLDGGAIDIAVGKGRDTLRNASVSPRSPYRAFGTPVIYLGHGRPLIERALDANVGRMQKAAPDDAAGPRVCPECKRPYLHKGCTYCVLRLICPECDTAYENPRGQICGNCFAQIEQIAIPVRRGKDHQDEMTPQRPGPELASNVSDWQREIFGDNEPDLHGAR